MNYDILPQRLEDEPLLDPLLDRTFGLDRHGKTVYRLREGIAPVADLCFSAVEEQGSLLASLRFWPIQIEETPAILLGPLAVEPPLQGKGIGKALVRHGLAEARKRGDRICVVVGEPEYYGPFGFSSAPAAGLVLPGPVDPRRFQVLELVSGALDGVRGVIRRASAPGGKARRSLRGNEVA